MIGFIQYYLNIMKSKLFFGLVKIIIKSKFWFASSYLKANSQMHPLPTQSTAAMLMVANVLSLFIYSCVNE